MKCSEFALRALGVCASLVAFAGCGGSQVQTGSLVPQSGTSAQGRLAGDASWMAPDARGQDLLYVAHRNNGIDVYTYPSGDLAGRLQNVRADGLCSNKNGDVFLTAGKEVLQYAHGGTRAIATLRNPFPGISHLCAVAPSTGDLAVLGGAYPGVGVAIYPNAEGTPKIYRLPDQAAGYSSSAYDSRGDLFVELNHGASVNLVELPKNGKRFLNIDWNGPRPSQAGSIQWDGKYLAVLGGGSGAATTLFRYRVAEGRAAFVGQTSLKAGGSALSISIHRGQIAVASAGSNAGIAFYEYPRGGAATNVVKDDRAPEAITTSVGVAIIAVTTYHYDNLRTGWDKNEYSLSYLTVTPKSFGLLHTVTLDDQVDTQPLVVPNEITTGSGSSGRHDVVYATTENNTVYAINAATGAILFSRNLGSPVPTPLGCNNNGPNVGIDGTPVIDLAANVMYVIAYTMVGSAPTYTIHELSLANLNDVVSPVVVTASHTLTNGSTYYFNATYQRQRPALLEANGNIYAGFGSFCDYSANESRGWLLGWEAGSLTPLAANQLNDSLATSPNDFFLSSIWMSGDGVAADSSGNLYFVTGNSDPSGTTYNGVTNVQESVVKMSSDLTTLESIFTPSQVGQWDRDDTDFGSGGVLLLPTLTASATPLAAAAGKSGTMYLLNQENLGGYNKSRNNDLGEESVGGCWCGLSYFDAASDSLPRIVGSGGNAVTVWTVQDSASIKMTAAGSSPGLPGGQDPGFFTAVSSIGNHPGAIIWALARPAFVPGNMELFAFKAQPQSGSTLETLYSGTAGYWDSSGGNANVAPVVANGKVYVASYKQLDILGVAGAGTKFVTAQIPAPQVRKGTRAAHQLTGMLLAIHGSVLTLRTRVGKNVLVDDSDAVRHERSSDLIAGESFTVRGAYDAAGVLHATFILRAKPSQSSWPPDH